MNRLQKILIGLSVVVVIGLVGQADFEHEQVMSKEYRDNVCGGYWPDYQNLKPSCRSKGTPTAFTRG